MKLTLCAIAKNAGAAIGGMIESAKDIVDEIVIVDTGSRDDTTEVAKQYTERVFLHPRADEWREDKKKFDFAEARNYALDQCTGDWVLILDCDERLDANTKSDVRTLLTQIDERYELVLPTMVMCYDNGVPYQEFLAERIMKPTVRFKSAMHNFIDGVEDSAKAAAPQIRILHNRANVPEEFRGERSEQRIEMNEYVFLDKVEADPTDRRSMFYLAGTYFDSGQFDKAIPWFEKYLEISDFPEERYQAAYLLAQCYVNGGERDKAKRVLSATIIDNYRRAEAFVMLGQLALQANDYEQAKRWYEFATLIPMASDPLFVEHAAHTWQPHMGLWDVYRAIGDNAKASEHGRLALELGAPNPTQVMRHEKNHTEYGDKRISVLVDRGQMDFIGPVIEHWKEQGKQVKVYSTWNDECLDSDIIFCEWAGDLAIELTKRPKTARIIVRIHGYELNTGYLSQIDWLQVDDVIFVAEYLIGIAREQVPWLLDACNVYVVPGGAETDKFGIGEGKQGNKIAMLGYVNQRKNIPLALQILAKCPDKELHIAGEWQDTELYRYICHMADEMGVSGRLKIYGRVDDRNAWFSDKDFILSTGIRETFHYALAEGMAAGLKPVIHAWESSRDFYDDKWLFTSVDEAVAMLQDAGNPEEYCRYAVENLGIDQNLGRIDRIIRHPKVAVYDHGFSPLGNPAKIMNYLESLGCRVDARDPEVVLLFGHTPRYEDWMGNAKLVLWAHEQLNGDAEIIKARREAAGELAPKCDLVLAHFNSCIPLIKEFGAKRVEYFPIMGACYPFAPIPQIEKKFDVGFYGSMNPYRQSVIEELGKHFEVALIDQKDHEKLNEIINACKIMLSLRFYDESYMNTRLTECMAAGACVVTEKLPEGHIFPADCIVETDNIVGAIRELLADDAKREAIAKRGHRWVWSKMRLERQVEKILELVA